MTRPLVSIIIPVYNGEQYLAEAIDSVLAQTLTDLELVVINDGSSDQTGHVLDKYALLDPRVRVIHRDRLGLVATREAARLASRGKYLAVLDADDIAKPERLERQTVTRMV